MEGEGIMKMGCFRWHEARDDLAELKSFHPNCTHVVLRVLPDQMPSTASTSGRFSLYAFSMKAKRASRILLQSVMKYILQVRPVVDSGPVFLLPLVFRQ